MDGRKSVNKICLSRSVSFLQRATTLREGRHSLFEKNTIKKLNFCKGNKIIFEVNIISY